MQQALHRLFHQLDELLQRLSPGEYRQPIKLLSGATIGQHCRHLIECFQELEKGYCSGAVNYDLRQRHRQLETDPGFACFQLRQIGNGLDRPDKPLVLEAAVDDSTVLCLASSYHRELYHNLDHTVHHMAIIRAGLTALGDIPLPESFGVATATMKYRADQHSVNNN